MHAVFIPYGKKSEMDIFIRDMSAQKHKLKLTKGDEVKYIYVEGQVRHLPFGFMEYIFPREDKDRVLATLKFHENNNHYLPERYKKIVRKLLGVKRVKEIDTEQTYLWIRENIGITPLGIKEDADHVEKDGPYKGWSHESL